ncbi:MAG TPA: hypothetical protein VLH15_00575 [Dehalococcoidales bacterium]|nr:hypothetical protein [Dehalococcoidales bacterium]
MAAKKAFIRVASVVFVLVLVLVSLSCTGTTERGAAFESAYQEAVNPYTFDFLGWGFSTFKTLLQARTTDVIPSGIDIEGWVVAYFQSVAELERIRFQTNQARAAGRHNGLSDLVAKENELNQRLESLRPGIQRILSEQISLALADSGIFNPFANSWFKLTLPPVSFKIESGLNLIVVSPRQKIERMRESIIRADISAEEIERMESTLEQQNVSALVIPLGGLGATYPSFVIESSNMKHILGVIAEEWLHKFMAFRPLGFRYVLDLVGLISDPDIASLNETAVGIAAQEIGDLVFQRYYAKYYPVIDRPPVIIDPPAFDFNAVMRETRLKVDSLLAAGQVVEAEQYMERQRQILVGQGYAIRKLNQAYFAFHGSYAYTEISVDPIGDQFRQLRQKSSSLRQYLDNASRLTSRQALQQLMQ